MFTVIISEQTYFCCVCMYTVLMSHHCVKTENQFDYHLREKLRFSVFFFAPDIVCSVKMFLMLILMLMLSLIEK